jgi:hypothetical protein
VNREHLKSVFTLYLAQWGKHYPAKRQDTTNLDPRNKEAVLSHTMWMCEQGLDFVKDVPKHAASEYVLAARLKDEATERSNVEKAMRWLGFIQGMLFYTGHYTIDEMRAHSASPTEP